jgi:large subunit ribosomal protein L15e
MYKYIGKTWQSLLKDDKDRVLAKKAIEWRRGPTIVRLEKPTRLDKARMLGYKAKQGFVVVRVKVAKGGMRRGRPRSGRRPKHLGVVKIKAETSAREVAERRASKKFPNLKVLNSYYVYEDGKNIWYEVIMVDSNHPAIKNDRDIWIALGRKKE